MIVSPKFLTRVATIVITFRPLNVYNLETKNSKPVERRGRKTMDLSYVLFHNKAARLPKLKPPILFDVPGRKRPGTFCFPPIHRPEGSWHLTLSQPVQKDFPGLFACSMPTFGTLLERKKRTKNEGKSNQKRRKMRSKSTCLTIR